MNSEFETALAQVAEDMFASMAFVLPLDDEEVAADCDAPRVLVEVSFSGPCTGRLALSISQQMLPILAANMLGSEDAGVTSPEQQEDALKEVLNVICGNLLPRIATPWDVFHVLEPRMVQNCEVMEAITNGAPEVTVRLRLEGGQADLALFVDHPAGVSV